MRRLGLFLLGLTLSQPAFAASVGPVQRAELPAAGSIVITTATAGGGLTLGGWTLGAGLTVTGNVLNAAGGGGVVPVTTVASSASSQTIAFPASGSATYDITLTANCAISLSGGTLGQLQTITLILRQDSTAGRTPALPAGVRWPGGVAPTPNTIAGKIDVFTLSTPDGGTTVFGSY